MNNERFMVRLWDEKKRKMVYEHKKPKAYQSIFQFLLSLDGRVIDQYEQDNSIVVYNGSRFIKMQCTGFRDSENNLIWEGDIIFGKGLLSRYYWVQWSQYIGSWIAVKKNIDLTNRCDLCELELYQHWFSLDRCLGGTYRTLDILGNIYEHPELLEQLK